MREDHFPMLKMIHFDFLKFEVIFICPRLYNSERSPLNKFCKVARDSFILLFKRGWRRAMVHSLWRKNLGVLHVSAKLCTWFRFCGEKRSKVVFQNRFKLVLTFLNITQFSTSPNDQLWQKWKREWHEKC